MSHARTGIGYDTHRLVRGRPLILGGVEIAGADFGLEGHSDADVLTHAIIDALLGAACMGDIGMLYPDSDPAYAGADSLELLARVVERIAGAGWRVEHVDCTLLLEEPKLGEHRAAILARLQRALGTDAVNVKATTGERVGFVGRGEGAAALASATLTALGHD
ncbi:MAG: 2-C-methyl-D-erythritol 2,4-cyclodiphosphate synthase [Solirubrobacteraceae bacterium]